MGWDGGKQTTLPGFTPLPIAAGKLPPREGTSSKAPEEHVLVVQAAVLEHAAVLSEAGPPPSEASVSDVPLTQLQRLWGRQGTGEPLQRDGTRAPSQWTALMHALLAEAGARGHTLADLRAAMAAIPVFPKALEAVRFAAGEGVMQVIVSDANAFFIDAFLEAHGLGEFVQEVHTNPATPTQQGVLAVTPHQPSKTPHACDTPCPVNLCKGGTLVSLVQRLMGRWPVPHIAYVGDGRGDTCAVCQLPATGLALVRSGYPLQRCLQKLEDAGKSEAACSMRVAVPDLHCGDTETLQSVTLRKGCAMARVSLWSDGKSLHSGIEGWVRGGAPSPE